MARATGRTSSRSTRTRADCDIMIPLKGALPFVDELHQILHAAAERD